MPDDYEIILFLEKYSVIMEAEKNEKLLSNFNYVLLVCK